ncbi:MAG TPA: ABC transporter ATP-binding protein, partial [Acidobacteriota bacterium]|nr:ABC transporter ATP-binding protein [Acidobacteriota bacterium]
LSLAARFCNRLLLLFDGMIVADGSPEEVLTEPNLARYFSIEARIRKDPESGSLVVWPVAPCLPL